MTAPALTTDRTGFPMIWVNAIDAYIHWIPVTKIQFEHFMCAEPEALFDAHWYDEILDLNPRVTPTGVRPNNYWQAFLTGITPHEAQKYAQWCGAEFAVPTLEDWNMAYKELKSLDAQPPEWLDAIDDLSERAHTLLNRLDSISRVVTEQVGGFNHRTLADQMLMRLGVMEWVECTTQSARWGGMGMTHPVFYGTLHTPDHGQPMVPINPETNRLRHFGFRLIKRSE